MAFNFVFLDPSVTIQGPTVGISKNGFSFNKASMGYIKKTHIIVGWDKEKNVLGLRPADASDPRAIKISTTAQNGNKALTKMVVKYNIPAEFKKHQAKWDEAEGMLIVQLEGAGI